MCIKCFYNVEMNTTNDERNMIESQEGQDGHGCLIQRGKNNTLTHRNKRKPLFAGVCMKAYFSQFPIPEITAFRMKYRVLTISREI